MASELHRWKDGRFVYRAIGGKLPRVERGGSSGGVTAWSGMTVCNDAPTVHELGRLRQERDRASRLAELQGRLLTCYRIGKNPGSLLDDIRKARAALDDEEASDE